MRGFFRHVYPTIPDVDEAVEQWVRSWPLDRTCVEGRAKTCAEILTSLSQIWRDEEQIGAEVIVVFEEEPMEHRILPYSISKILDAFDALNLELDASD